MVWGCRSTSGTVSRRRRSTQARRADGGAVVSDCRRCSRTRLFPRPPVSQGSPAEQAWPHRGRAGTVAQQSADLAPPLSAGGSWSRGRRPRWPRSKAGPRCPPVASRRRHRPYRLAESAGGAGRAGPGCPGAGDARAAPRGAASSAYWSATARWARPAWWSAIPPTATPPSTSPRPSTTSRVSAERGAASGWEAREPGPGARGGAGPRAPAQRGGGGVSDRPGSGIQERAVVQVLFSPAPSSVAAQFQGSPPGPTGFAPRVSRPGAPGRAWACENVPFF